jgi:hypothetical protein
VPDDARPGDGVDAPLERGDALLREGQQRPARRREGDAPPLPLDDRRPEQHAEAGQGAADGGLRHTEDRGSGGDLADLGDHDEDGQQTHHRTEVARSHA